MYLHYAETIANGYRRTMPCPFQTQGLLLNPYGDLYFCENSEPIGNVLNEPAEELYFKAESQAHRADLKDRVCPTCLSPCQVNVGAMKQVVPYLQFLVRAYRVNMARNIGCTGCRQHIDLRERPADQRSRADAWAKTTTRDN